MTDFEQHKAAMAGYLAAFTRGDLGGVLSLFSAGALVHSPTQSAPRKPAEFYPILLEKAKGTVFALKAAFAGEQPGFAAALFDYSKPQAGGGMKTFDCVDIFSFDADGKIKELWIIFDTKNL